MQADANRRTATIIWGALVAGVAILLWIALFLAPIGAPDPELSGLLLLVASALAAVSVALSWLWAVRAPIRARPAGAAPGPLPPGAVGAARLVVAAALCEGPSLAALVFYLLTGDARMLLPFALSFGALLAHFPRERHWARLCRTGEEPGQRPNRMIR
ncbi:MAG TPA: hypothetical protein VLS93_08185 [Anaeromyxobacteraceae bacterium]|nr:hypothetical protein [Anaeromyxobacteraceae bacterium]